MKVSQLIAKLKKMPKDAEVVWLDHDCGNDISSVVGSVCELDSDEIPAHFESGVVSLSH